MIARTMLVTTALALASAAQAQTSNSPPPMTAAAPAGPVSFEIYLPLRDAAGLHVLLAQQQTSGHANFHHWLTPDQFRERFGPAPDTMARTAAAARAAGLNVIAVHSQSIEVAAPVEAVNRAFATTLMARTSGHGPMLAREPVRLPAALKAEGAMVAAFKSRLQPRSFSSITDRAPRASFAPGTRPFSRNGIAGPYYYNDLKQAYDYPAYTSAVRGQRLDGTGASIAVVISNDVLDSDVQAQFDDQGFTATTGKPAPRVKRLVVNGGAPFDFTLSGESSLDVEQALGGAPGADVTLVNIPTLSNDQVIAGYRAVVEANAYDIVSSSFGQCELFFGSAYNGGVDTSDIYRIQDQLFMQGNAQGMTFLASSGDSGALGCASPDIVTQARTNATIGVNSPANSPFVTSVGGGNLVTTINFRAPTESRYRAENGLGDPEIPFPVFGGSTAIDGAIFGAGGGVSTIFPTPAWQRQVGVSAKGRAIPDVGFFVGGCPGIAVQPCGPDRSGAILYLGGQVARVIGTSVASPQLAGALALVRQFRGERLGNINPYLYAQALRQTRVPAPGLTPYNRNQPGFDGVYFANRPSTRYDYIFGNGSMNIRTLFGMTGLPAAGNPKSPSNP